MSLYKVKLSHGGTLYVPKDVIDAQMADKPKDVRWQDDYMAKLFQSHIANDPLLAGRSVLSWSVVDSIDLKDNTPSVGTLTMKTNAQFGSHWRACVIHGTRWVVGCVTCDAIVERLETAEREKAAPHEAQAQLLRDASSYKVLSTTRGSSWVRDYFVSDEPKDRKTWESMLLGTWDLSDDASAVVPGSVWRHYNGEAYTVRILTNLDSEQSNYEPTVVYEGVRNGKFWSRPLMDWHRSFTRI